MDKQKFSIEEVKNLPHSPGIYKFYDKEDTLIYIGKAKDLRKRVSSYFTKGQQSIKTLKLVSEVNALEVTIVDSEFDALLLENNLIKENQPKYNILLKDDKSFPSILITNERFPKIYATRRIDHSKGQYFGPYTSVKAMNSVLDLIRKLYKIRTCNLNLSEANVSGQKFKVCLEYHLGNCLGPCEALQSESDYMEEVEQSIQILKSDINKVKSHFTNRMNSAASELNFEQAEVFKQKLELLEKFQAKSLIVSQKVTDIDIISLLTDDKNCIVNYMRIDHGTINVSETVEIKKKLDETDEEVLLYAIINLREKYQSSSREILTNIEIESWNDQIKIYQPKIGDKKKLVDLSKKNGLFYKKEKISNYVPRESSETRILNQLQSDLRLNEFPDHIECFDNSNIQGTNPVASMVCFKNGKPSKKDYRHFNIKTVVGPDDFGSMKEIVFRRYKRLKEEELPYPKLIVIDGGKGQLNAAIQSLIELDLYGKIPIIGIAKKLEELYFPNDPFPLHLSKKSESLKLIQYLRDEAHRFAITFHRTKRSQNYIKSELDSIKGIGEKSKIKLLTRFRTVSNIKKASVVEIAEEIGLAKAEMLKAELGKKKG